MCGGTKTLLWIGLTVALLSWNLTATDTQQVTDALLKAADLSDLRAFGSPPFEMNADIEIPNSKGQPFRGTYHLAWISESKWREDIALPGYARTRIGGDNKYWQQRNVDYELRQVQRLSGALDFVSELRHKAQHVSPKIKTERREGNDLKCVFHPTDREHVPDTAKEFCLDAEGTLAEQRWAEGPSNAGSKLSYVYFQYVSFGSKLYPRIIRVMAGHDAIVVFTVAKLDSLAQPNESDFVPPQGVEPWETCAAPEPPLQLHAGPPHYPELAKANHITGVVTTYVVVGADGTLSNLKVLSAPDPSLAKAATDAMRSWTYRPAHCNGVPIRWEMFADIHFQMAY
jgi:TonB family protein